MTAGNTITVPITVGTPGGYTLTTTVNGVTFAAAGILNATTPSITLNAIGTPSAAAAPSTTFVLSGGGGANCNVTIPFTAAPAAAVYTFTCGSATFAGTYQVGTAMTAGNTITVPVTVATPGSYSITSSVNGVIFTGSGNLTATTPSITLNATGLPTAGAAPSTTFVLSGGGGANCSVTIPFTTGGGATNYLRAKINGGALTNFNTALTGTLTASGGTFSLEIIGDFDNSGIPWLGFNLDSDTPIAIGTYTETSLTNSAVAVYTNSTGAFVSLPFGLGGTFSVTITSITTSPNRVIGTFTGTLKDGNGLGTTSLTVTAGEFSVSY
jgi:hypothetical protein